MEYESNYDKFSDQGREKFLTYDQESIIQKFQLKADDEKIYLPYLNDQLEIIRSSGCVMSGDQRCDMNVSMTVYDILTNYKGDQAPTLSNKWVSLNDIGGIIAAGHMRNLKPDKDVPQFAGKVEALKAACEKLGGMAKPVGSADVSYVLPLFPFFPIWFQMWDADDEFPVSLQFQWDSNSLDFLHYETMWYVLADIKARLLDNMR